MIIEKKNEPVIRGGKERPALILRVVVQCSLVGLCLTKLVFLLISYTCMYWLKILKGHCPEVKGSYHNYAHCSLG